MPPMRLILDAATMVAAIRSDAGASHRLLVAALKRRFMLLASVPLMIEYQAVMTRPEHPAASGLSADELPHQAPYLRMTAFSDCRSAAE